MSGLGQAKRIAVDTETTGLRPYGGDVLRGISLAWQEDDGELRTMYVPVSHPGSDNVNPASIINLLNTTDARLEFHNGPFDWHFLGQYGFVPRHNYRDSQVLSWLWQENGGHTLKGLGADVFGIDAKAEQNALKAIMRGRTQLDIYRELREDPEWKARPAAEAKAMAVELSLASRKTWATLTAEDIRDYARQDAELTYRLVDVYEDMIANSNANGDVSPAVQREHDFQHVIYDMVKTGIMVDPERAQFALEQARARHTELREHYETWYGVDLNKNAQVARLVYDEWDMPVMHRTPGGAPSVARAALDEMKEAHTGVSEIVEYRGLGKAMSTYFDPLLNAVGDDGRVHSSFSSCRTVTGRLSSSDPNLMNIPRRDTLAGVRDVFVAAPGMELWEFDLNQAELRVAASFCDEDGIMSPILGGRDIHSETALRVFGPDFTDLQRRLAKNLNYGFPYGIGPRKFASYIVKDTGQAVTFCPAWHFDAPRGTPRCHACTVCEAASILDGFRVAMPNLVQMMNHLARYADKHGILPLHVPGRYRRFRAPGRPRVPGYTALNAIVQGGVAEFMKDMMLALDSVSADLGYLVLQVHDSLVLELEPGAGPEALRRINLLSDQINPFKMPMPFDGSPWSDHA